MKAGKYGACVDAKTKRLIGKAHSDIKAAAKSALAALAHYDCEDDDLILTGDLNSAVSLLKIAEGIVARHSHLPRME